VKEVFKPGDIKFYSHVVRKEDVAFFSGDNQGGLVHPVYATFALAREAEWVCRLFVLEMREEDEEGLGTMVTVTHVAPAFVGNKVEFRSKLDAIEGNEIICSYEAFVDGRLIAHGKQGQKILKKEKIERLLHQR